MQENQERCTQLTKVISRCWEQDPEMRPTGVQVRELLCQLRRECSIQNVETPNVSFAMLSHVKELFEKYLQEAKEQNQKLNRYLVAQTEADKLLGALLAEKENLLAAEQETLRKREGLRSGQNNPGQVTLLGSINENKARIKRYQNELAQLQHIKEFLNPQSYTIIINENEQRIGQCQKEIAQLRLGAHNS